MTTLENAIPPELCSIQPIQFLAHVNVLDSEHPILDAQEHREIATANCTVSIESPFNKYSISLTLNHYHDKNQNIFVCNLIKEADGLM